MRNKKVCGVLGIVLLLALAYACGGGSLVVVNPDPIPNPPGNPPPPPPPPTTVFLIVMENQSYESMVGSAEMPYLNSLIPQGAIADQYFANTHPSIGNYFML